MNIALISLHHWILGATAETVQQDLGKISTTAIIFFFVFITLSLGITYWAAKRTKTTSDFYAAGHSVTGVQNGFALAGDYMSAASFLGIAGLVAKSGFDGLLYSTGFLVGWPLVLFLIAESLRSIGKYTFADVVAFRLNQKPVRVAAAFGTIAVVLFYLIAQMVGAGKLIQLLFGLQYEYSIVIVGGVMMIYVLFGGMIATTWVQIIKACLLLGGATLMAVLVLSKFGFNPLALFAEAAKQYNHDAIPAIGAVAAKPAVNVLAPGPLVSNPWDAISLGLSLMIGTAGLAAHSDAFLHGARPGAGAKERFLRHGSDRVLLPVDLHPGLRRDGAGGPEGDCRRRSRLQHGRADAGGRDRRRADAGLHRGGGVRHDPGGGRRIDPFGCQRAFARSLGQRRSGTARLRKASSSRWRVSRRCFFGIAAVVLGLGFKTANVAYMVGLAFAIAASANFPALFLSIFWRRFTTAGRGREHVGGRDFRRHPDRAVARGLGGHPQAPGADLPAEKPGHRRRSRSRSSWRSSCRW